MILRLIFEFQALSLKKNERDPTWAYIWAKVHILI